MGEGATPQFDIVIATLNRESALRLSVPRMLTQSALPANFIVVDASDNHNQVKKTLESAFQKANTSVRLKIVRSEAGSSLQRNVGLEFVESPIVFFPDDDALWFDGFSEAIMKVYTADTMNEIGGVAGTASSVPPPGVLAYRHTPYRMELHDLLSPRLRQFMRTIETFFPDPLFLEGHIRNQHKCAPSWLQSDDNVAVSNLMSGFLMTFRADLIRKTGFDETLGRYAAFEDRDASLAVLDTHLIARAVHAHVFHYRVPGKRVSGFEWGFIKIANCAYILCKHTLESALSRRYLRRFSYYKLLSYLLQAHTSYGRARVAGALSAIRHLPAFLAASKGELPEVYTSLRKRYLGH
jgi:glycosyltransferase involved in cell wall biosynthesis